MSTISNFKLSTGLDINGDIHLNGSAGTSGQVLQSAGAGAIPTWVTASGGITLADDTSTNATYYPAFSVTPTPGSISTIDISSTKLTFNPSTGTLSSTIFASLSDETQKKNINLISNAIETISKIDAVTFNWIDNDKKSMGVIAQQLETILPELVNTDELTDIKSVNYNGLIGLLIAAVQELIKKGV